MDIDIEIEKMDEDIDYTISELDEIFTEDNYNDPTKNYERIMNTLSYMQSTIEFDDKFYDDNIIHIHAYRIAFPCFRDIHKEIESKIFRNKLAECDYLIDRIINTYDMHRWFDPSEYYRLNELLIETVCDVWKEGEIDELGDMFANMKTN